MLRESCSVGDCFVQFTSGRSVVAKTTTVKAAQCVSMNSAHAQPDIGRLPATPNVPKSEVGVLIFFVAFGQYFVIFRLVTSLLLLLIYSSMLLLLSILCSVLCVQSKAK